MDSLNISNYFNYKFTFFIFNSYRVRKLIEKGNAYLHIRCFYLKGLICLSRKIPLYFCEVKDIGLNPVASKESLITRL